MKFTDFEWIVGPTPLRQPEGHRVDDDSPAIFIQHVGHAIRCTCGRYYVAGYRCPADKSANAE